MKISIGNDVMFIPKVQSLLENNRLHNILRASEIKRSSLDHIAGRIALKEAAIKALGLSVDDWLKIIVVQKKDKPHIELVNMPDTIRSIECSVSHDQDYAFATVIVLYR